MKITISIILLILSNIVLSETEGVQKLVEKLDYATNTKDTYTIEALLSSDFSFDANICIADSHISNRESFLEIVSDFNKQVDYYKKVRVISEIKTTENYFEVISSTQEHYKIEKKGIDSKMYSNENIYIKHLGGGLKIFRITLVQICNQA